MDPRLKNPVVKTAGKAIAVVALSWLATRPRVAKMLERRPLVAKAFKALGVV